MINHALGTGGGDAYLFWFLQITIRNDDGTGAQKWSKLGLILVIIIGRWLLPRGELTRDQLSALLLVYVANAADIMGKNLFSLWISHLEKIQ